MALQVTRGVLCKVNAREELEILRQAWLDAQRIINRLGLLYGRRPTVRTGADMKGAMSLERIVADKAEILRGNLDELIEQVAGTVDDEAAADDLFARAAQREREVGE